MNKTKFFAFIKPFLEGKTLEKKVEMLTLFKSNTNAWIDEY